MPVDLVEHVVEQDGGVRQDHPLHRGVADVPLVPQGDVLERGQRVACAAGGRARRPARTSTGLRLWGIALEPFWPSRERLLRLQDLRPLQAADLRGDLLQRRGRRWPGRSRTRRAGRAGRSGWRPARARGPRARQTSSSTSGSHVGEGARPRRRSCPPATASRARRRRSRFRPASAYQTAALRPNVVGSAWIAVGAAHAQGVAVPEGQRRGARRGAAPAPRSAGRRRPRSCERQRGVHHVRGGEPDVDEAGVGRRAAPPGW